MTKPIVMLTLVCAVGSGLAGGVFVAFSTFVMKALADLPAPAGIAAMQSVNAAAPTPPFLVLLLGTAAATAVLAVWTAINVGEPGAALRLVGCVLYLVALGITVGYHVPHNDALARLDPTSTASIGHWTRFVAGWTAWNHLRAAACVAGAAVLTAAVRAG